MGRPVIAVAERERWTYTPRQGIILAEWINLSFQIHEKISCDFYNLPVGRRVDDEGRQQGSTPRTRPGRMPPVPQGHERARSVTPCFRARVRGMPPGKPILIRQGKGPFRVRSEPRGPSLGPYDLWKSRVSSRHNGQGQKERDGHQQRDAPDYSGSVASKRGWKSHFIGCQRRPCQRPVRKHAPAEHCD